MLRHLEPAIREADSAAAVVLPGPRRVALERWMRGREEAGRLARADPVVVSFGNSGRTWLRVLLSRFYQTRHGLPRLGVLDFDNLHRRNPAIPRVLFTHDNYLADYTGLTDRAALYRGKRLVLLARDPADVAVSQFYQWRHRMRRAKKRINGYPLDEDLTLPAFVADPRCGVPKVVRFLNAWAAALPALPDAFLLRYEDLRAEPERRLGGLLAFLGGPATRDELEDAVAFASLEGMRRLEDRGERLIRRGRATPESGRAHGYKARRGKVGGYRDELPPETAAALDALIDRGLDPVFGYRRAAGAGSEPRLPGQARREEG